MNAINKYLRKMRIKSRLSQADVSSALGYKSAQFISNVENGKCGPALSKLRHWCELIDADVDYCKKILFKNYKDYLDKVV